METRTKTCKRVNAKHANNISFIQPVIKKQKITFPQQDWLILMMEAFGYKSNRRGICYGVAHMGVSAMLIRDIQTFNERLAVMYRIYTESVAETTSEFKETPQDEATPEEKEAYQQQFIKSIKQTILKQFSKLSSKNQVDMLGFFDGVELFHQSFMYPHLFPKFKLRPTTQNASLTAPLVASISLSKLGGMVEINDMELNNFSIDELQKLLEDLSSSLDTKESNVTEPVAFCLLNPNVHFYHAASIGYDPITHLWTMVNANQLPAESFSTANELAKQLFSALFLEKYPSLIISAWTSHSSKTILQQPLNDWKHQQLLNQLQKKIGAMRTGGTTERVQAIQKLKTIAKEEKSFDLLEKEVQNFYRLEEFEKRFKFYAEIEKTNLRMLNKAIDIHNRSYLEFKLAKNSNERLQVVKNNCETISQLLLQSVARKSASKCSFLFQTAKWAHDKISEVICTKKFK